MSGFTHSRPMSPIETLRDDAKRMRADAESAAKTINELEERLALVKRNKETAEKLAEDFDAAADRLEAVATEEATAT